MDFGGRLRIARRRMGLSQTELAARVGCAQSLVAKIEKGEAKRSKYLVDFARELRVPAEWFSEMDSGVTDAARETAYADAPLTQESRLLLRELERALASGEIREEEVAFLRSLLKRMKKKNDQGE